VVYGGEWGLGSRIRVVFCRWGIGAYGKIFGVGFRVWDEGFGLRSQGSGFRIQGVGSGV